MTGMLALKSWLERNHPFLTASDIEFFKPFLAEKFLRKEEMLLVAGSCCRELSFIVSGVFRLYCPVGGKEVNLHFFTENEFVADYGSFLGMVPARYSIQSLEHAHVVTISREKLFEAYDRSKNWERLGRLMAEQFACMFTYRLEKFLFMDGMERYRALMEENPRLFDRVPLYHLASYLGMERESLSRIRQRLCKG